MIYMEDATISEARSSTSIISSTSPSRPFLPRWRRYVNKKEDIRAKIKNLYEMNKRKIMPQPHETLREWDGKIDGYFLINQMMTLKNEIQYQSDKQRDNRPKLQNKSESYKGNQDSRRNESEVKPRPQAASSSNQFTMPKVPAESSKPVFEANPKLKLSKKKDEDSEYVLKPHTSKDSTAPKGLDVAELEFQLKGKKAVDVADLEKGLYVQKKPAEKKVPSNAVDVESLEKSMNPQPLSYNIEDLEKDLLAPKKSQPTDIEEIEAQMQKASKN